MTKLRPPITPNNALTKIAAVIGWDTCASILGKAERTVRNWSDPDTEAEISLLDAMRLDAAHQRAGGDGAPLFECYALRLEIDSRVANAPCLIEAAQTASKEAGEAISALLLAAQSDNPVNRRNARRELEESISAQTEALRRIDARESGSQI